MPLGQSLTRGGRTGCCTLLGVLRESFQPENPPAVSRQPERGRGMERLTTSCLPRLHSLVATDSSALRVNTFHTIHTIRV